MYNDEKELTRNEKIFKCALVGLTVVFGLIIVATAFIDIVS